jgi:hypothetical protein
LDIDDPIWDHPTFSNSRKPLLEGHVAHAFLDRVLTQAQERALLLDDRFAVDGRLIEV